MELTAQAPDLDGARASARGALGRRELENLWDRHGGSAYALAYALLADEVAAAEAVRLAMVDLARSRRGVSTEEARRCLGRHVYRHAQEPADGTNDLARLQCASLALCVLGRLPYREAAVLLDVPPSTVADLLTAGLRELGRRAACGTETYA